MHTIPNDRALAHWKALNGLPDTALNYLKARFLREQPLLCSVVLPMTGGLAVGPDGREKLPNDDDPKLDDFWRLTTTGAIMNEIMCREAGRPLRRLTEEEVLRLTQDNLAIFGQVDVESSTPVADEGKNVFTTCSQPHLLTVATVAHFLDDELKREAIPTEVLLLRLMAEGLHHACGGEPTTTPRSWDAERIQFALSTQGDPLRREALAACEIFRAELLTWFISELDGWVNDTKGALEEDGSLGMHAMFLLAQWREDSAWPVFRKLFSLPGDIGYDLLGDLITEDGSILLAMVVGGRRDELRAMIEDETLDEYCRNACIDALTCLVVWGELPRAEHVAYLRELLTGKLRGVEENKHAFGGVVSAVCDLEAWELRPEVEVVFERGWVDEDFIDMEFLLDVQAGKIRNQWQAFCESHHRVTDVAASTKWLDNPPTEDEPTPEDDLPPMYQPPFPLPKDDFNGIADSVQPYLAPPKVGRNDPCSCGSGKKFKKCCGV